MTEEIEVTVVNEKSARDFLKSKRAISFLVYMLAAYMIIPLLKLAIPELEINISALVTNSTTVVLVLISCYTGQDVVTLVLDIISTFVYGRHMMENVVGAEDTAIEIVLD